jgi:hypothetical protein
VGVSDTAPACDAESAARGFLQGLERRSEAAGADLSRLESMAFGTVSFEELLGHCGEALAMFSRHADAIESRLVAFGYVPPGSTNSLPPWEILNPIVSIFLSSWLRIASLLCFL